MNSALNYQTLPSALRFLGLSTFAITLSFPAAWAQDTDAVDQASQAYQASMTQSDVKRDAAAIQQQLMDLRAQMVQLMPNDVATVDKAIAKMKSLSQGEMDNAIKSLQDASKSNDAQSQVQKISDAMKSQGAVSNDLKKLAVDLKMRETIASMGTDLSALLRRQVSVYSELKRLGKEQQTPDALRNRDHERYVVANDDQQSVTADLKLLGKRIDTLSADITDDTKNGLVKAAGVAKDQDITGLADKAAALTASGPFNDANTTQVQVIQSLVAMEQALSASSETADRLRAMADRLKAAESNEKDVVDAVMQIGNRQDLKENFKQMQADLDDEVVSIQYEIQPLNNQAAAQLSPAADASEKALLNFKRMWEEHMDARTNTQTALQNIDAAYQLVAAQVAQAEANQPQNAAQLAAALDQLQREVAQAAQQQAMAAQQPIQPAQQQAMAARANGYQQRALPISPDAANSLAQAAASVATATPQAQQAAAQELATAAQELAKQAAQAAQVAAAQAQVAQAQADLAKAQQSLDQNQTAQAANDLNAAQQNATAAQQNAATAAPDAANAAAQAAQDAGQGQQAAAQTQGGPAKADAAAAQAALAQAADGLRTAAGQLPGMGQGGTQVSDQMENQGPSSAQSKANGGGGKSGDGLAGAGDNGGSAEVLDGLSAHDRDAVAILQNEKPPREYVPQVQQYYKNIADGAGL